MYLTITLRKEVVDQAQGQVLYDIVVNKLADHPDVSISGNCSVTLPLEPPEVPE